MKIKQRIHIKHIKKQQSDSSGKTAWLSMADKLSPVPGLSMLPSQQTKSVLCVRTEEVVSAQTLSIINMRVGLSITVSVTVVCSLLVILTQMYQIKWLHYILIYTYMHLAQFTYLLFLFFFLAYQI